MKTKKKYNIHKKTKHIKKNKKKTHKSIKKKNNASKFIKLNCSPENKGNEFTCYTDDDLKQLKQMWYARHPDKPIQTNDSKKIWLMLKNYYRNICNKESCWIKQMTNGTKMEKELLDSFAPKSPNEWKKKPE